MPMDYITRLKSGEEVVYESTNTSQSDSMVAIVEFLIEEREILDEISLPYSPGRRKSPLLDNIQGDLHGQEHEVSSDYYVDTLANRETKKKNIKRLAAECDLSVDFEGEW